jgi:hypothetical protein
MKKHFVVLLGLGMVACQANTSIPAPTPELAVHPDGVTDYSATETVTFTRHGLNLSINKPLNWETQETENGLMLTEHFYPVTEGEELDGTLDGLLLYVFVPPLDDVEISRSPDENIALAVMNQVVKDSDYVQDAAVTRPVALNWAGYDAAYYLLDKGDGNLTMMLTVAIPGTDQIIACHISMPGDEAPQMRDVLPQIFEGFSINGVVMDNSVFHTLPDPLQFPKYGVGAIAHESLR